jgi:hypothetical protein
MATKLQFYQSVADRTIRELTARSGNWIRFLDTAARLYKYPFQDQMMIHAQRPDATACADYDFWPEKFNRWVRRGSKGIALIDESGTYPRLKYVFDVSDTEAALYRARPVQLWEMRQEHKALVLSEFAKNYEDIDLDGTLADAFRNIANQLAREYYEDNHREIAFRSENSVLEPEIYNDDWGTPLEQADDTALQASFIDAVTASVAYSVMARCGLDASEYLSESDFHGVIGFNTPDMAHALGVATAELSEQVLRDIEITIRKYERLKNAERSEENYDRNPYLHNERGLSPARHHTERAADERGGTAGTLGLKEESVPQRTQEDNVQPPADLGEAVPAPAGSGRSGEPEIRADNGVADGANEPAGQGGRPDEVDGGDEHAESADRGSDSQRTDLQLGESGAEPETENQISASETPQRQENEPERGGVSAPSRYKYYSTQRPVDIGAYPRDGGQPAEIVNYDERTLVEGDTIRAWGYLIYGKPLTEAQISDYELRAAPDNPDLVISAQIAEADLRSEPEPPEPPPTLLQFETRPISETLSEPKRNELNGRPHRYNDESGLEATGTYGKRPPTIMDDVRTISSGLKPPTQGGGKASEIDI